MPRPALETVIAAFEAEGVKGLQRALEDHAPSDTWLEELVRAITDERASVPATWMLRAYLERGADLSGQQTALLLRSLAGVAQDDARLHLCQSVGSLDIPARNAEQLARFLRGGVAGEHKFTRAWATDAFHRLALQHPRYKREALKHVERALRDPAASVRARARHIDRERARG